MPGPQTNVVGPVRAIVGEYDGEVFISGRDFLFDVGTWTPTRLAAGSYTMRKTANAETTNPGVSLLQHIMKKIGADPMTDFGSNFGVQNPPKGTTPARSGVGTYPFQSGHAFRGVQVTEIDVIYGITIADLTSLAAKISQTTYADNVAISVVDKTALFTGAAALAKTFRAGIRVVPLIITAPNLPYVLGNNADLTVDWFELNAVAPGTTVLDLYGIQVKFNYNLL